MRPAKRLPSILLILLALLSGCGNNANEQNNNNKTGNANTNNSGAATSQPQGLLSDIKASGKLVIGTEGTYAPFTFHDANGKLTGFDVDIAKEVSKRLGVESEFIETQWDGIFAGLDAKRFDAIFNEVAIRDDRKEKYDFSDPYIVSKAVLLVREDNNDITSFADLKGKKSAQSLTSNLADIAKANGAEIVGAEGFNQAIDLLLSNRVDATINDSLSYLDALTQRPDLKIKQVDEEADASYSGALFRKGSDDLTAAVNDALAAMKSDGTYLTISKKYFGTDVSQ
ncbi:amino acid ABC transporter substrate-binding protein [Paenibacillus sp. HB172176]|uniref:amino acid ABC transporter substrate-binding protein n=1 Tax=Paenibacillus sp. HB172176 TaxID=2493690 RepID=UPI001F10B26F|nr:amino acid ABC transporter substrate-binding protein [Paenibacillus sp. HB172176]